MNAADGDDGDDGATNLSSYERATSMAELLARLGESRAVQVAEARAGTRPRTASRLTPCHQHRERVRRGQAGPEWWATAASVVALLTKEMSSSWSASTGSLFGPLEQRTVGWRWSR